MVWIASVMGVYTKQFVIVGSSLLESLFCALLYGSRLRRRKWFPLWLLAAAALCLLFSVGIAVARTEFSTMGTRLIYGLCNYCVSLVILLLCFQERIHILLITWCAAIATQEIGNCFFSLLLALAGVDDRVSMSFFSTFVQGRDWAIYYGVRAAVYLLCFFLCGRRFRVEDDQKLTRSITALMLAATATLVVLSSFIMDLRGESRGLYMVAKTFSLLFAVVILIMRSGLLLQRQYRQELSIMERELEQGRKQYENVKENIDVINMKCHDLKHRLADLEGRLTAQEVADLQEAIQIYDHNIKTGCETLDVILCEKQLVCQKEGILMTCMADGESLSFMTASHIYSLFANAIDNAIEAVREVEEKDKRVISITVRPQRDGLEFSVTNYFAGERRVVGDLPVTTKADKNRHGFGVASMKYIAQQYGGALTAEAERDMFTLTVRFPAQRKQSA